jgi:serine/threonine protein kinase/HAMP domain-containing protein
VTATTARRGASLSLATRTFLVSGMVIVLAIGVSILVTSVAGERIARRGIARVLDGTEMAQDAFQQQHYGQLQLIARLLGSDPHLVAYIAQAAELVETRSILDILYERQQELGCEFVMVLDTHGRLLARTDAPDAPAENLSARALVAEALASNQAAGIWQEGARLYDAVVVPLAQGMELVGYLAVGFAIDDRQALAVKQITGPEIVYVSRTAAGPAVVASTLPPGVAAAVLSALAPDLDRLGQDGAGAAEGPTPQRELRLSGMAWIALVRPLRAESGGPPAVMVALASLDDAMRTYRQIETLLVIVGLVSMLPAFVLSYALSQRLVRPVRELAGAAEAARRGDYDRRVGATGDDEVGRLARAFDSLLADLREKRDMQAYLADLARSLPEADLLRPASAVDRRDTLDAGLPTAAPTPVGAARAGGPATESQPLAPGTVLGQRYEILGVLGSGGMGIVYKAFDRQIDEIVALKMLRPEILQDTEQLERLKGELKMARRITHPNVLRTHDFDVVDGMACISMEYVHGITLRRLLQQSGRVPYTAGLHLARQLCAGLAAAHAEGVIHRDIKPENLILQQNGDVKLTDFGLARPLRRTGKAHTRPGHVVGTPHYMSPELLREQEPGTRSDLYAVGIVLYEMFTGVLPFNGQTVSEILAKQLDEMPRPLHLHWSEIPPELERIILRCLEKEPSKRHASVQELIGDLEALRRGHVRPPSDAEPPTPRPGRRPSAPGAAGIAIAVLGCTLCTSGESARAQAEVPGAGSAAAETTQPSADPPGGGLPRPWLFGDVRMRGDFVSKLPPGRDDLNRGRMSLRLGLAWAPVPQAEIGAAFVGALGTDINADNPRNNDNERSDTLAVNQAYVRLVPFSGRGPAAGGVLTAGKMELPLWLTPLVWDDDLRPVGVAYTHRFDLHAYDVLRIAGGGFVNDHLYDDGSRLAAAQAGWLWREGAPTGGELQVAYLYFGRLEEVPPELFRTNTVSRGELANDYQLLDVQVAVRTPLGPVPFGARVDLVHNFGADAARDGSRLAFRFGDATVPRHPELAYVYQRIERDAVLAGFNGDDWWFHSRARGHLAAASLEVAPRLTFRVSAFFERRDDLDEWTRRLLIDLRWVL